MTDLDAIRARRAAITPGPWEFYEDPSFYDAPGNLSNGEVTFLTFSSYTLPDVQFIAAAPADIDALLTEVERLRAGLTSIAKNTCCDGCQEAAHVAQAILEGRY